MKFSILVPIYNVEKYLEQCLNSLIGQTFRNFEIVLIDDGSKDNSGKICGAYQKNTMIWIFQYFIKRMRG